MNKCWDFNTMASYLWKAPPYQVVEDGDVLNYVTHFMKLTRGKLLQQDNWTDWQDLEFLQLDQYDTQGSLVPRWLQLTMMIYFIWCGLMQSRLLTVIERLGASVMALLGQVWFVSL